MRQHVFDTNALYRYLTKGKGHELVAGVLRKAAESQTPLLISAINWGELYYKIAQLYGLAETDKLLTELPQRLGITVMAANPDTAIRAARLKARYRLPYADAFAAELTGSQHVLVTADVDHFMRVPKLRLLRLPQHGQ